MSDQSHERGAPRSSRQEYTPYQDQRSSIWNHTENNARFSNDPFYNLHQIPVDRTSDVRFLEQEAADSTRFSDLGIWGQLSRARFSRDPVLTSGWDPRHSDVIFEKNARNTLVVSEADESSRERPETRLSSTTLEASARILTGLSSRDSVSSDTGENSAPSHNAPSNSTINVAQEKLSKMPRVTNTGKRLVAPTASPTEHMKIGRPSSDTGLSKISDYSLTQLSIRPPQPLSPSLPKPKPRLPESILPQPPRLPAGLDLPHLQAVAIEQQSSVKGVDSKSEGLSSALDGLPPPLYVVALYDYNVPDDPWILDFRQGEVLQVLAQLESGWWDGVLNDVRGWFPSNYTAVISPDTAEKMRASLSDDSESNCSDDEDDFGGPEESKTSQDLDPAAFWVPQATPDGRLFYFNTLTGEKAFDLPRVQKDEPDASSGNSETGDVFEEAADASDLPQQSSADCYQDEAAFWVPQATPDGRLFYFNTLTGVKTFELPL